MEHIYGTELTAKIRETLAQAGYKRNDFNVRLGRGGYDTAIYISIKNPKIRKSEIEKIVKRYESIDRDPWSHEIFIGGNTFIFVEYRWDIFDEVIQEYLPQAEEIFANIQFYNGKTIIENKAAKICLCISNDNECRLYEITQKGYHSTGSYVCNDTRTLAEALWRFNNIGTIHS